jgi:hypothetical protein
MNGTDHPSRCSLGRSLRLSFTTLPWCACNLDRRSDETPLRPQIAVAPCQYRWCIALFRAFLLQVTAIRRYPFPWPLWGKDPATSVAILSNGTPTLYWCIRPRLLVRGPRLAAQVSQRRNHSTSCVAWSRKYICLTLYRVLLTPTFPPDGPPCSSTSTSFTLHWGRTIWSTLDRPSANYQWRSKIPSFTATGFHLVPVALVRRAPVSDLTISGVVQPLLLQEWVPRHELSADPVLWWLGPVRLHILSHELALAWHLHGPSIFNSFGTLLGMAVGKEHRQCCASGLCDALSKAVFLEELNPAGCLPFKFLKIHERSAQSGRYAGGTLASRGKGKVNFTLCLTK